MEDNYWLDRLSEEEYKKRYYNEELFEPLLPIQKFLIWTFISFTFLLIMMVIWSVV